MVLVDLNQITVPALFAAVLLAIALDIANDSIELRLIFIQSLSTSTHVDIVLLWYNYQKTTKKLITPDLCAILVLHIQNFNTSTILPAFQWISLVET